MVSGPLLGKTDFLFVLILKVNKRKCAFFAYIFFPPIRSLTHSGLVIEHNLEVTNSFALPRDTNEDGSDDLSTYQTMMLRLLREVNIDHLQVGWYQSSNLGAFLTEDFISIQYQHQSNIEESVVLIYG